MAIITLVGTLEATLVHPRLLMGGITTFYTMRDAPSSLAVNTKQAVSAACSFSTFDSLIHISSLTDHRENVDFTRPERIRFSSLVTDAVSSSDSIKVVCGICQKLLRRKPCSLGDSPSSSGEFAVVAVLVCGHMYHAECLEGKTSLEHTCDPRCPLCCV
ncbi:unnamed protein product [Linum tenue]|uniref:RING-type domain-containing protein n=1 Tax=Linum tenue TaxID=586396 RepID=A0AAV0QC47_9ROSI|nr:unnamed protein product [Linum tenue]